MRISCPNCKESGIYAIDRLCESLKVLCPYCNKEFEIQMKTAKTDTPSVDVDKSVDTEPEVQKTDDKEDEMRSEIESMVNKLRSGELSEEDFFKKFNIR